MGAGVLEELTKTGDGGRFQLVPGAPLILAQLCDAHANLAAARAVDQRQDDARDEPAVPGSAATGSRRGGRGASA
jgi:hypothetical protein